MLRDAKEAFREKHHANRRTAVALTLRAVSTKRGGIDVGGAVVLDRISPRSSSTSSTSTSSTSTSSSKGSAKMGGALGLKEFMHRTRVLDLYRGILKVGGGNI